MSRNFHSMFPLVQSYPIGKTQPIGSVCMPWSCFAIDHQQKNPVFCSHQSTIHTYGSVMGMGKLSHISNDSLFTYSRIPLVKPQWIPIGISRFGSPFYTAPDQLGGLIRCDVGTAFFSTACRTSGPGVPQFGIAKLVGLFQKNMGHEYWDILLDGWETLSSSKRLPIFHREYEYPNRSKSLPPFTTG